MPPVIGAVAAIGAAIGGAASAVGAAAAGAAATVGAAAAGAGASVAGAAASVSGVVGSAGGAALSLGESLVGGANAAISSAAAVGQALSGPVSAAGALSQSVGYVQAVTAPPPVIPTPQINYQENVYIIQQSPGYEISAQTPSVTASEGVSSPGYQYPGGYTGSQGASPGYGQRRIFQPSVFNLM